MSELHLSYNPVTGQELLKDDIMLKIPLSRSDTVIDAYAMDDVVFTRTKKGNINFYMKPLAAGAMAKKLRFD